jgi:hypothetical protein
MNLGDMLVIAMLVAAFTLCFQRLVDAMTKALSDFFSKKF